MRKQDHSKIAVLLQAVTFAIQHGVLIAYNEYREKYFMSVKGHIQGIYIHALAW